MKNVLAALSDVAQGASNAAASTVTAPVDLINWLLQKAGLPVSHAPVGGSAWAEQKGLTRKPQNALAGAAGETLGMVAPIAAAAKAPQIAKGLLQMGENAAAPRTLNPQTGAIVWHGSPHKFDRFDSSKIGTGEGAQAYGHGLYLAESPGVAKTYQKQLGRPEFKAPELASKYDQSLLDVLAKNLNRQTPEEIMAMNKQYADYANETGRRTVMGDMYEALKSGDVDIGNIYKVDLPDPVIARMLDWDKPLSQQAPAVRSAIQRTRSMLPPNAMDDLGGDLSLLYGRDVGADSFLGTMNSLQKNLGETLLRKAGVPGVRYLDGGSRGAGSGTSNFVVFPGEENILTILERNGIPLR